MADGREEPELSAPARWLRDHRCHAETAAPVVGAAPGVAAKAVAPGFLHPQRATRLFGARGANGSRRRTNGFSTSLADPKVMTMEPPKTPQEHAELERAIADMLEGR